MAAYNACKDDRNAYQARTFSWIRNLGTDLVQNGQTLLTHPHDPALEHWLALVIDTEKNVIYVGDSLSRGIPANILSAYRWWMSQHTQTRFAQRDLPTSRQDDDHSCGLLATNALCHFADPDTFPLADPSAGAAVERMKAFCLACQHILAWVSFWSCSGLTCKR
jgi:hypothetical protein